MANSYTRIHLHFICVVKYRRALIDQRWEEHLHKYMTGIVQGNGHKMIVINSALDHTHFLVSLNPKQSISDLMQVVKCDSSEFINKQGFADSKFRWQGGYGGFAISKSHLPRVINYIVNQKEHHNIVPFRTEYLDLLKENEIEFDERYIFHEPE